VSRSPILTASSVRRTISTFSADMADQYRAVPVAMRGTAMEGARTTSTFSRDIARHPAQVRADQVQLNSGGPRGLLPQPHGFEGY
jgi:hypothetical protein